MTIQEEDTEHSVQKKTPLKNAINRSAKAAFLILSLAFSRGTIRERKRVRGERRRGKKKWERREKEKRKGKKRGWERMKETRGRKKREKEGIGRGRDAQVPAAQLVATLPTRSLPPQATRRQRAHPQLQAGPALHTRTASVSAFAGDNLEPALFRSGGALLRVANNTTPSACPSPRAPLPAVSTAPRPGFIARRQRSEP